MAQQAARKDEDEKMRHLFRSVSSSARQGDGKRSGGISRDSSETVRELVGGGFERGRPELEHRVGHLCAIAIEHFAVDGDGGCGISNRSACNEILEADAKIRADGL